ncbi:MAG: hypothetical protein BWK76_07565 [Desulfobulbaceae bacterium A2]|nr:MAG: hypothetical protein BWK76_07565 [Desulfobulbaceae bacterium A2]
MLSGMEAALTGLQAYGTKMQATAHNVANLNTEGFKRTRVLLQESSAQGVETFAEQDMSPGAMVVEQSGQGEELREQSNSDLGNEFVDMMVTSHGYSANLKVLQTSDQMLGSLLDITA